MPWPRLDLVTFPFVPVLPWVQVSQSKRWLLNNFGLPLWFFSPTTLLDPEWKQRCCAHRVWCSGEGAGCPMEESGVELGPFTTLASVTFQNGAIPEAGIPICTCLASLHGGCDGIFCHWPTPGAIRACSGTERKYNLVNPPHPLSVDPNSHFLNPVLVPCKPRN